MRVPASTSATPPSSTARLYVSRWRRQGRRDLNYAADAPLRSCLTNRDAFHTTNRSWYGRRGRELIGAPGSIVAEIGLTQCARRTRSVCAGRRYADGGKPIRSGG